MSRPYTGRREDARLVTGKGRYTTDWNLPGQVHGSFVRADRGHATIRSIDASDALAQPGVLAVLTGADAIAAGYPGGAPAMAPIGKGGIPMAAPRRPVLAADRVRFVGELVALVIAETRDAAQDAAELVFVDYEDLPVAVLAADAAAPGAPQLHEAAPGNLGLELDYGDAAATDAAFAAAAHIAKVTVEAQRIVGNPMEPKSCVTAYDAQTGAYDLYISNQGISNLRGGLSTMTGVAPDKLKIQPIDVGGAFGIRVEGYPEYAALMLASKTLGRPVKWTGTRAETFLSDHQGRGVTMTSEMAMDANGRFLGLRIDWLVDVGAYWSNSGPGVNGMAPVAMAVNVYEVPAVHGQCRLMFTNAVPTCAYRGASRPNCSYLMERLVDEAARVSGIDRLELRRRNFIPAEAFPYTTPTGSIYDSGDPAGLMALAVDKADWAGFPARRALSQQNGKRRGIGCAVFISPSGMQGHEQGLITFDANGKVVVHNLAGPSGQGHETVFPEVVADVLGLDVADISLSFGKPDGPALAGLGTFGSRSLISHGGALHIAAQEVVTKGALLAAEALDAQPGDIAFEDGLFRKRGGNESISLRDLIIRHGGGPTHPLDTLGQLATQSAWPSGAHIAEVEIDDETGVLEVVSYVAVDDCGKVFNHTLVEGQTHGGLMQGLGQVLGEHALYDPESGQVLTGSFMDYYMPRAHDTPHHVGIYDRSVLAPGNPLGGKGAGEAGATGAIPTIANAVIDALSGLGITQLDTPYTPNRLWTAMQEARG